MRILFVLAAIGFGSSAMAEPAYCDPAQFKKFEVKYNGRRPSNLHVYKLGRLTLAGMAVGNSNTTDVIDLAQASSKTNVSDKFCTWYFNDGNPTAARAFNWHFVPRPTGSDYNKTGDTYMKALGTQFDQASTSFASCAVNSGYLAMGCDGMKHRGPSVFAMFLAYAGCTADHAATIATNIWGNNGITTEMRKALAQRAADVAAANPSIARQLQAVMSPIK